MAMLPWRSLRAQINKIETSIPQLLAETEYFGDLDPPFSVHLDPPPPMRFSWLM